MAKETVMPKKITRQIEIAYKDALDNLMFLKQQEWAITRYALAVYAALFALRAALKSTDIDRVLEIIVIVAAVFATSYLVSFELTIAKHRNRLRQIYCVYFTDNERKDFDLNPGHGCFNKFAFVGGFLLAIIAGAAISVYEISHFPAEPWYVLGL